MRWLSDKESIVKPERFAVELSADTSIMCFTRPAFKCLIEHLHLNQTEKPPSIAGSQDGAMNDSVVVYECAFGAPAASMHMEAMIASGVKRVIMVGDAGSISPNCRIGDIVLPTWGIREEGTSFHYLDSNEHCTPSEQLIEPMKTMLDDVKHEEGGVWTTDAPFRETPEKVAKFRMQGALAVEMECTALMAIAKFRGIDFGALLVITDELFSGEWKPGFNTPEVNSTRERLAKLVSSMVLKRF